MTTRIDDLPGVLARHREWVRSGGGKGERANLTGANLTGANIDYSAWPLWCGSYNVKVDKAVAAQLAMHFCWLACDDPEVKAAQEAVKKLAMKCKYWNERE